MEREKVLHRVGDGKGVGMGIHGDGDMDMDMGMGMHRDGDMDMDMGMVMHRVRHVVRDGDWEHYGEMDGHREREEQRAIR